ncbi:MAG: hypothetical protein EHM58_04800 [Ignavibacteriae bacterium]|nr:MAG: hypothetical protein EHM58_04800 [Ignavibacteriota bacterium]
MPIKHIPYAGKFIDDYINDLPEFSKAICNKLREIIFEAEPDIIEDWKWGPNYYKDGMVCGFAGFKQHVHFSFFNGSALKDTKKIFTEGKANQHNRGIKFKNVNEIDEKLLIKYIKEAVKINEKGLKPKDKEIEIPADFKKALNKAKLLKYFENTNFTNRKEYCLWITGAKKEETRSRRIEKAIEKIGKGLKFS